MSIPTPAPGKNPPTGKLPRPGKAEFTVEMRMLPVPGITILPPGDPLKPANELAAGAQPVPVMARHYIAKFKLDSRASTSYICLYDAQGFEAKNKVAKTEATIHHTVDFTEELKSCLPYGIVAIIGQSTNGIEFGEYSDPKWYKVSLDSENQILLDDMQPPAGIVPPTIGPVDDKEAAAESAAPPNPSDSAPNPPIKPEDKKRRGNGGKGFGPAKPGAGGSAPAAEPEPGDETLEIDQPGDKKITGRTGYGNLTINIRNVTKNRGAGAAGESQTPPLPNTPPNPNKPQGFQASKNKGLIALLLLLLLGLLAWGIWYSRKHHAPAAHTHTGNGVACATQDQDAEADVRVGDVDVNRDLIKIGGVHVPNNHHGAVVQINKFGTDISINDYVIDPERHAVTAPGVDATGRLIESRIVEAGKTAKQFEATVTDWLCDTHATRTFKIPCDMGDLSRIDPGTAVNFASAFPDAANMPPVSRWELTVEKPWTLQLDPAFLNKVDFAVDGVKITDVHSIPSNGTLFVFHTRTDESVPFKVKLCKNE